MRVRKFICWLVGHRSIYLFRHHWGTEGGRAGSETTGWKCERCEYTFVEQWDQ